ncbi:leishmanolysin [Gramella lutea]|uniref:Leishmanolysin n=1 Tax=Christiangramia lutea TaxID=1607951 RepID=A0A9X1V4L7_9FLAO|nr:leishmanolysin [Christiangramia lutea]MCH4824145.1 leishmanolysin [Christiangramia lutea]
MKYLFPLNGIRMPFRKGSQFTMLSLALFSLIFFSCSEDQVQPVSDQVENSQVKDFTLIEPTKDLIQLEAKSGDDLSKRATQAAGPDRGRFNITLRYLVPPTDRQREVFDAAAARWERSIIKDLPSVSGEVIPSAFGGVPPIITAEEGIIDDLIIEVVLIPIDGPGNILGSAGPRFVRIPELTTISGVMQFDVADLATLEEFDLFEEVIVHEMGHVLGIGTLWNLNIPPLGIDRQLRFGPESDPYYGGKQANVFWNAEGGEFELPIENMGGPGTRLSHWRESALNNELMTGFLNLGYNPLSRITAGSLEDLGYGTANVGEQYDLPRGTEGVDPDNLSEPTEGLNIAAMEELLEPIGVVKIK